MNLVSIRIALISAPFLLFAIPAEAAGLNGSWRGNGYIQPASGQRERVRCVVKYARESSKVYRVRANCASKSGSVRQTGELLKIRPNYYAGDFYNRQFDIGGRIRVRVSGSGQIVTFSGDGGSGRLTLRKR